MLKTDLICPYCDGEVKLKPPYEVYRHMMRFHRNRVEELLDECGTIYWG